MRMRKNLLKTYHYCHRETKKDKEGASYKEYGAPVPFEAIVWPANGGVQAQLYGEKLSYIMNLKCSLEIPLNESDGIQVETDKPEYKIISIKKYTDHQLCEIEKL